MAEKDELLDIGDSFSVSTKKLRPILSGLQNNDAKGVRPTNRVKQTRYSRYKSTLFYQSLDAFGPWNLSAANIPPSDTDIYYEVRPEEQFRLDLISFRVYSTPQLWWVIALANNISNTFTAPTTGNLLRIPSIERILNNLIKD